MSPSSPLGPRGLLDRLVGLCLSFLVAAVALSVAVHLIEAVWNALLLILAVGAFVVLTLELLHRRGGGW